MTAAEAHAAADAEGLLLVRAENPTGFKGVNRGGGGSKPFQAKLRHDGSYKHLGNFATAEEAALAVARLLGREGVAAALAADEAKALEPAPMSAAEAHAAAVAEGLALLRAETRRASRAFTAHERDQQAVHGAAEAPRTPQQPGPASRRRRRRRWPSRFLGPEGVAAALAPLAPEP